jgi:hypothetical protein
VCERAVCGAHRPASESGTTALGDASVESRCCRCGATGSSGRSDCGRRLQRRAAVSAGRSMTRPHGRSSSSTAATEASGSIFVSGQGQVAIISDIEQIKASQGDERAAEGDAAPRAPRPDQLMLPSVAFFPVLQQPDRLSRRRRQPRPRPRTSGEPQMARKKRASDARTTSAVERRQRSSALGTHAAARCRRTYT